MQHSPGRCQPDSFIPGLQRSRIQLCISSNIALDLSPGHAGQADVERKRSDYPGMPKALGKLLTCSCSDCASFSASDSTASTSLSSAPLKAARGAAGFFLGVEAFNSKDTDMAGRRTRANNAYIGNLRLGNRIMHTPSSLAEKDIYMTVMRKNGQIEIWSMREIWFQS